jgi:hypothetical protein
MNEILEFAVRTVLIGAGATIVMDLWAIFLRRIFDITSLDYRLLGRWVDHLPEGRFVHDNIAQTRPVRGEAVIGWTSHYLIGITFAALLISIWGLEWARQPSLLPALFIGIVTVAAPFLVLQPGLGAGVAGAKTPKPGITRLKSLTTHLVYGAGLYIAALIASRVVI